MSFLFVKIWVPFNQGWFVLSLVESGLGEEGFLKIVNVFYLCHY